MTTGTDGSFPRPLTGHERAVLDLFLAVDFDGAHELRAQACDAQVSGVCGCGCGSYDLSVSDDAPRAAALSGGPLRHELAVTDPGGELYGAIILLVFDGRLGYLDFHTWDDGPLSGLPPVDHLSLVASPPACSDSVPKLR